MAEDGRPSRAGSTAEPPARKTYGSPAHFRCLLDGLQALRQGGILYDVVLLVEGRRIQAHRILLAASCDYFRGMFAGGLREAQQQEVLIQGVSHTAMKKILDFFYTSEMDLDLECVQEVLIGATLLQLELVIGFCCDFLFSWLDESNILEVHRLAEVYGLQQLQARVHAYILGNVRSFSRCEAYRQLPQDEVFRALSSDRLQVDSEKQVYEAALHYHYSPQQVETDQVFLQDDLRMLRAVRFSLMERAVLQRLSDRLSPCPLRDSVGAALRYHEHQIWQPVLQSALTQPRSTLRCVLAFGGMFASAPLVNGKHVFLALQPGWAEWRTLPTARAPCMSNQGVAVLRNFVYLIGGDKNTGGFQAESCCWRYDPRHNSWCAIQPMQQQHADHCVCVVGEHIYTVGGRDYSRELDSVERYDPRTNSWEFVSPLKKELYAHAGAVLDGKMYVTCGRRGASYLRETLCYDPAGDSWTACADGPVERAWHGMAALNGRIYVIGGSNQECSYRRDVLKVGCFDPDTNSWSLVAPLPAGHGEPGVAVLDDQIYVLGGRSHDKGNRMKHVHVYSGAADQWTGGAEFRERVSGLAACVVLMPPAVVAGAKRWEQRSKASWEDVDNDDSEESSED